MEPSSWLELLKSKPESAFAWLRQRGVLRAPLTLVRLGIPFRPEWDANGPTLEELAAALEAARPFAPGAKLCPNPSANLSWAAGINEARAAKPQRGDDPIELEMTVEEQRSITRYYSSTRTYSGMLALDRATVLEYVADGDERGLRDYIRDCIDDDYSNWDESDNGDDYCTDEDNCPANEPLEFPDESPRDLAARLMDELAEEAEEEEEEE